VKNRTALCCLLVGMLLCGSAVHAAGLKPGPRYVIVTTKAIVAISEKLDAFVASKQARGFSVSVATEDDWGGGASGLNRARNIRNWLQKQWRIPATRPTYVLLIGDPRPTSKDGVPMLMASAGKVREKKGVKELKVPTDLYYAELTSNWDKDGDGKIGELGDDLHAKDTIATEVLVGRIPFYGAISGYPVFAGKGPDDLTTSGALSDPKASASYEIRIVSCGKPDTYVWSGDDGKTWSEPLPMAGKQPDLCPGVKASFGTATGHQEGDLWTVEVTGVAPGKPKFEGNGANNLTVRGKKPKKGKKPATSVKRTFILKVTSVGAPDAFEYRSPKALSAEPEWSEPVLMMGGHQALKDGISIKFKTTSGHTVGDTWRFQARQYLDSILAKTIAYENAELSSIGWRFRALLPMNEPYGDGSAYPLGEEIRTNIISLAHDWSYHRVYKKDFGLKPPPETIGMSFEVVTKAWQDYKPGYVTWLSHGTSVRVRSLFHGKNALEVDDSHPVINFHASCLTGQPERPLNVAVCLLRNGAVAVISGTRATYGSVSSDRNWRSSANDAGSSLRFTHELILKRRNVGQALDALRRTAPPRYIYDWVNYLANGLYGCPAIGIYTHRMAADGSPQWFPGYPRIEDDAVGRKLVRVRADVSGRAYWVALPEGSPVPTSAQVKAGQDAAAKPLPAGQRGVTIMAAGMPISTRMQGVDAARLWDVYTVGESARGVLQPAPTKTQTVVP